MTSENRIHQVALEFKEFDNRGKDMERHGLFRNEMGEDFPVLIIPKKKIGKHDGDNYEFYVMRGKKNARTFRRRARKTGLVRNAYIDSFA